MASLHAALICLALPSAGETVLYDFTADWCVPCRMMEPTVNSLKAKGYPIRKVNIDREPALKQKFGVDKVPSFVLVKDGRVVARAMGMARLAQLEGMMNQAGVFPPGRGVERALAQSPDPRPQPQSMPATTTGANWQHTLASGGSSTPRSTATRSADLTAARKKALAATVRLEITDRGGASFGTGTVIDVDGQDALVLTCGHVFRDAGKTPSIKVTLYDRATPETIEGRLVGFSLDRDIGLVAIRPRRSVSHAPVAAPSYRVGKGQQVISVGCNHGAAPTVEVARIRSLNKYQGPANLQIDSMPVQGRSGGGLFSADGYVVGVCNAADPADREGLFAAAASIHRQLDSADLTRIYRDQPAGINTQLTATEPPPMPKRALAPAADRFAAADSNWAPGKTADVMPKATPTALANNVEPIDTSGSLLPAEKAALSQIQRALGKSEVIMIISNPDGRSEIIVLDKASPAFRKRAETMAATYRAKPKPHYTSHKVEHSELSQSPYLPKTSRASAWQPSWK